MKPILFTLALLGLSSAALADVVAPGGKTIECYCTDKSGSRIELGQVICLQVDGRMFMAQCQMSLNVPMWREVQAGCLSSRLKPSFGFGQQLPHTPVIDPKIAPPKA